MTNKMSPSSTAELAVPGETIERWIYLIRGQKVMLDADSAELYQVKTGNLKFGGAPE